MTIYPYTPEFSATSALDIVHIQNAHERAVIGEDGVENPYQTKDIKISTSPYPFDTPLSLSKINKESTLPADVSVELQGDPNTSAILYIDVNETGYEHRDLTVQEINPNNPDDPNNTNSIHDIRSLSQDYGMYRFDIGNLEAGVVRMFRFGVYTKLRGDMEENGQIDPNDLGTLSDEWLNDTYVDDEYVGNNYDVSDRNHDGLTDFLDFTIMAADWLEEE